MIAPAVRRRLEDALGDRVRFEVPMTRYTSLGVGGPADAFATPADRVQLAAVLALIGLWVFEKLWVEAGQAIPLS